MVLHKGGAQSEEVVTRAVTWRACSYPWLLPLSYFLPTCCPPPGPSAMPVPLGASLPWTEAPELYVK